MRRASRRLRQFDRTWGRYVASGLGTVADDSAAEPTGGAIPIVHHGDRSPTATPIATRSAGQELGIGCNGATGSLVRSPSTASAVRDSRISGTRTFAPHCGQMARLPARNDLTLSLCPLGHKKRIPMGAPKYELPATVNSLIIIGELVLLVVNQLVTSLIGVCFDIGS